MPRQAGPDFSIEPASSRDVPLILQFIRELAEYEQLLDQVTATEASLDETLFGPHPAAEVVIASAGEQPAGFAVFFQTYSTFLSQPGMYLEDLFVRPEWRRRGLGGEILSYLASIAVERGYGRLEWSVLNWNEMALRVYRRIGAQPMSEWTVQRVTGSDLPRLASTLTIERRPRHR
jgi:GNAT superfamily N-acetyltransferase